MFHEFWVGAIQRVLQRRRNAPVIFRADKNVAVELGDFLLPAPGDLALGRNPGIGSHFVEEGHWIFAQIEDLDGQVLSLRGNVCNPPRGFMSEACGALVPTMTAILTLAMAALSWLWFDTKAT